MSIKINIAGVGDVTLLAYVVVDSAPEPDTTEAVVLVNRHTDYDPFVTWKVWSREGGYWEAFWGHYFNDYESAKIDFDDRAPVVYSRTEYEATLGWIDGALENESLEQAAQRTARAHKVRLHIIKSDPFNYGCALVTFRSPTRERLIELYCSADGGGYAPHDVEADWITEVTL